MNDIHYSMIIQWDEDDKIFVVDVPELPGCMTHGKTYEEAVQQGKEAIEGWLETAKELGWPIPAPKVAAWQSELEPDTPLVGSIHRIILQFSMVGPERRVCVKSLIGNSNRSQPRFIKAERVHL